MENVTMVKYTAEQIDQVLALLTTVASDTKSYECSLPMMAIILDINNFLRNNAVVYREEISEGEIMEESEIVEDAETVEGADRVEHAKKAVAAEEAADETFNSDEEIILSGGRAE